MTLIKTRSVELDVLVSGDGDPPFLFVHGWAADGSIWQPQFEDLSSQYRCVNVNLRGRGASPPVLPCDVATAAEDLLEVSEALELGPAIVVGHDLGGLMALVLNHRHPEAVLGVVTGDTPMGAPPQPPGEQPPLAREIRSAGSLEPATPLIDGFVGPGTPPEVSEHVRRMILGCPVEIAAGMLDNAELQDQLDTLVKKADEKPFMAFWAQRPMGDPIRLRELVVFLRQEPIAEAGHFFQLERPDITNALLRAFVDDVRRDPRVAAGGGTP